jgi:hypothetical protein
LLSRRAQRKRRGQRRSRLAQQLGDPYGHAIKAAAVPIGTRDYPFLTGGQREMGLGPADVYADGERLLRT